MRHDEDGIDRTQSWIEERLPGYRFGPVLILLFLTFVFMASGFTDAWARTITILLQGLTLLAALIASRVSRRWVRIAAVLALVSLLGAIFSLFGDLTDNADGLFSILSAVMVVTLPFVIGHALYRRRTVDIHTVLGAVCIYVLVGMIFAFVYSAIGQINDTAFFAQVSNANTPDYLYFSFVTQTTVGYGDLTAVGDLGRSLAVVEALTGQLYLVTVIAVLVSRMAGIGPKGGTPTADPG